MNNDVLITVVLLIIINLYGYLYSYIIVKHKFLNAHKIQPKNIDSNTLLSRIPLVSFNVFVLIMFNVIGLLFFKDYFIKDFVSFPILCIEVLFVLLVS